MFEGYDDCPETGLEEILAEEPEITDFENVDDWREEIAMGFAAVKGDLYRIHADEYLEEINDSIDELRGEPGIDDRLDWQDEVKQAIDEVRQNEG